MALSYNVMFGDVLNINIRNHEDANSITFNIKDENAAVYDVSNFTNLTFRLYDNDGLPYSDYLVTVTPTIGTGTILVSWDFSAVMGKLNHGYKYFYRIDTDDTGFTNQHLIPVKGEFYNG